MNAFEGLKTSVYARKISKGIFNRKDKGSLYSRLRLFMNGYWGALSPKELDMLEVEYDNQDKAIRAAIKEAKDKI